MPLPRAALPTRLDILVGHVRKMLRSGSAQMGLSTYVASVMQYLTAELNMQIATT